MILHSFPIEYQAVCNGYGQITVRQRKYLAFKDGIIGVSDLSYREAIMRCLER